MGVPRERGPLPPEAARLLRKSKLRMLLIHFDSKCLLKRFLVGVEIKKGQDLPMELLNSFLVLFQLFYKNKIKLEKLIKLRVRTPQYMLGK